MFKYLHYYLFSFCLVSNIFAQEVSIPTQFSQDGSIYKSLNENLNEFSNPLAQFKEHEECTVIDFLGKDNYKIKYKDWVGLVKDSDLVINEDMIDLFYAYQKKARLKAIEERENRQKKVQEIANKEIERKALIERKRLDSIAKVEDEERKALIQRRKLDSIAKAKEAEQKALIERKRLDSITKTKNEERKALIQRKKLDSIEKAKEAERKALIERKRLDSIAKVEDEERKALTQRKKLDSIAKAKEAEQKALIERKRLDSIAKVEDEERKALTQRKKLDSIAKAKEAEQKALIERKRLDSIAKVKDEERKALIQCKKLDSITKVKEAERKALIERKRLDAIAKVKDEERKALIQRKKLDDSIAKVKEAEQKALIERKHLDSIANIKNKEINKFKNTCHYQINEYDEFYKEIIIRTEPYEVSENLTVELYQQGHSTNIFFNLLEDLGCASYLSNNRSYVKVQLENNETITFYHSWDIECGDFNFKGRLSKSQIIRLKKSPIKSIKLKGTKSSSDITSIKYKMFFIDKLKCLE